MRVRLFAVFAVAVLAILGQAMVSWDRQSEAQMLSGVDQGEFVISYSSFTYKVNASDLVNVWSLEVFSNGTCYANFTDYAGGAGVSSRTTNISEELAREVFDGILSEWSDDMLRRYRDLGVPSGIVEQAFSVEWYNESIGAVFEGNSMMGVMPWTYSTLLNIYDLAVMNRTSPLEVSLELSAIQGTDMTTSVGAVFTNNEEVNMTEGGTTLDVWKGHIVRVNGRTAGTLNGGVLPTTWITLLPGTVTEFSPQDWNWSGASPGFYVVMARIVVLEYIIVTVPDSSGAVNRAPVAEFSADNVTGNRSTVFEFDAMMSWDWEDNGTDLEFRWDWNGDRRWDLEWTPSRIATNQFYEKGEHVVTMQVRDSQGLVNETTMVITIDEGGDLLLIVVVVVLVAAAVATIFLMRRMNGREAA